MLDYDNMNLSSRYTAEFESAFFFCIKIVLLSLIFYFLFLLWFILWYCCSMPKSQPLISLTDNTRNPAYTLRKSPTHSIKFLESTEMVNEIKKKRKQGEEENHQPLKLRLTIVNKKRGRPKNTKNDKEDEEFFKTFGHKITKSEANTKRGTPTDIDILYFEKAKLKIEASITVCEYLSGTYGYFN